MPANDGPGLAGTDIRETYEEYTVGATRVATIADPENTTAWIQSTVTAEVEQ